MAPILLLANLTVTTRDDDHDHDRLNSVTQSINSGANGKDLDIASVIKR